MEIKLSTVITSREALQDLFSNKLDFSFSFKLSKLISCLDAELKTFQGALDKFKADLGLEAKHFVENITQETDEKIRSYNEQINNLAYSTIVKLPIDSKIKLEELQGIKISPAHLSQLDWLIDG